MTNPENHHLQLEVNRLTTVLDEHERHVEHLLDVVRAAHRLYDALTGPVVEMNGEVAAATRNLGNALKAAHQ